VGRKAGSTGFAFSKAMKGAGFNWSEKHLFAYLKNPGKHVPGNKMSFAGLNDENDRANLIAYLASV
jgi:cytochrome c